MIVEDVRIVKKDGTIGDQHDQSFIIYFDIQVKVFDNWWSLDKEPKDKMDLQEAIAFRDQCMSVIRGTN